MLARMKMHLGVHIGANLHEIADFVGQARIKFADLKKLVSAGLDLDLRVRPAAAPAPANGNLGNVLLSD